LEIFRGIGSLAGTPPAARWNALDHLGSSNAQEKRLPHVATSQKKTFENFPMKIDENPDMSG